MLNFKHLVKLSLNIKKKINSSDHAGAAANPPRIRVIIIIQRKDFFGYHQFITIVRRFAKAYSCTQKESQKQQQGHL